MQFLISQAKVSGQDFILFIISMVYILNVLFVNIFISIIRNKTVPHVSASSPRATPSNLLDYAQISVSKYLLSAFIYLRSNLSLKLWTARCV